MPAAAPPIGDPLAAQLVALGQRVRAQRKALGLSAVTTAEAAGMSRVTLHRIERGEPSVTMGAYTSAVAALGLGLELVNPRVHGGGDRAAQPARGLPATLSLADYPQLARLAWQLQGLTQVTPRDALALYERNWRHVDQGAMDARERSLVAALAAELAGGRLLV